MFMLRDRQRCTCRVQIYTGDALLGTLMPARPAAAQQRCSGHPAARALPERWAPAAKEQLLAAPAAAAAAAAAAAPEEAASARRGRAGPAQAQPTAGRWAAPGGVAGPVPLLNEHQTHLKAATSCHRLEHPTDTIPMPDRQARMARPKHPSPTLCSSFQNTCRSCRADPPGRPKSTLGCISR